jgi:hypothetical protein
MFIIIYYYFNMSIYIYIFAYRCIIWIIEKEKILLYMSFYNSIVFIFKLKLYVMTYILHMVNKIICSSEYEYVFY